MKLRILLTLAIAATACGTATAAMPADPSKTAIYQQDWLWKAKEDAAKHETSNKKVSMTLPWGKHSMAMTLPWGKHSITMTLPWGKGKNLA